MLKTFCRLSTIVAVALTCTVASNGFLQAAPIDLSSLTCEQAIEKIRAGGRKPTNVRTGPTTYDNVYKERFNCPSQTRGMVQTIKTSDDAKCHIGFTCGPDSINN